MTDEEEETEDETEEEEQLTPRSFRDGLDELIKEHREDRVADTELQEIMWSRIIEIDRGREEETPYLWEG